MIRLSTILVVFIIILYLLITENIKVLKRKELWIGALLFIITIIPYLIWNKLQHGRIFAFTQNYSNVFDLNICWF